MSVTENGEHSANDSDNSPAESVFDDTVDKPVTRRDDANRYCLRCHSPLDESSISESRCPGCGLTFNPDDNHTYYVAVKAHWRFWFPGLCLAIGLGVLSYAVTLTVGDMGSPLFVGVPVAIGAILGYATRVKVWSRLLLAAITIPSVVMVIVSMELAGIFCGVSLGMIFCLPVLGGIGFGVMLRMILKRTSWDQRVFLPVLLIAALPPTSNYVITRLFPRPIDIVTIETDMTFPTAPETAWNQILFYEEVKQEPPWLLKLSLPRPVRTEGHSGQVGDVKRCVYEKGHLSKRITGVETNRQLDFEVVEQKLHFERDVTLLDGSFELSPNRLYTATRVTLRTRYQRHLSPRWVWEPIERQVVHTLHKHVMEGMRRKAVSARDFDTAPNRVPSMPSHPSETGKLADHPTPNRTAAFVDGVGS